ncbi:MAG: hydroxyacid dehydrogenase [Phycisphaerae bacterium]|nr:hydroxyacid dehydrogenase [Phycisphaerae bacterium]
MKILVACELPEFALDELRGLGAAVEYLPEITTAELAEQLHDTGILIVAQTAVSPDAIERSHTLQMIVCAGTGGDQVAVDVASAQGVFVCHCPGKDAVACAELAMGLILALDRDIVNNATTLREGRWDRERFLGARGLAGRTLGILASCPVCKALSKRAQAFEMNVIAWMPQVDADLPATPCGAEFCNWPREVARRSDYLVVHTPADDKGETVVNAEFLENLYPGSALVHVGDFSTIDESALVAAIKERNLRVALDVYPGEPARGTGRARSRLLQLPSVIGTHHISGATEQARHAIANEVVRIVARFLVHGEVISAMNLCDRSPATWQLVLRLRDQVGVMAAILEAVRADGINAEEITSQVFSGAKAAWCTIALDERPSTETLKAIQSLEDVLHLELRAVV